MSGGAAESSSGSPSMATGFLDWPASMVTGEETVFDPLPVVRLQSDKSVRYPSDKEAVRLKPNPQGKTGSDLLAVGPTSVGQQAVRLKPNPQGKNRLRPSCCRSDFSRTTRCSAKAEPTGERDGLPTHFGGSDFSRTTSCSAKAESTGERNWFRTFLLWVRLQSDSKMFG